MREMTQKRYQRIREAAGRLYGTMPAMKIYLLLSEQFALSDERIRKILAARFRPGAKQSCEAKKMHPP